MYLLTEVLNVKLYIYISSIVNCDLQHGHRLWCMLIK